MVGHELAIEQREIADLETRDEPGERDLGSIAGAAEHALAEERAAELDAVKPANELARAPDLDGMSMTRAVQREHRAFELRVDPGLLAVGAGPDHCPEVAVAGDVEAARTQHSAQ